MEGPKIQPRLVVNFVGVVGWVSLFCDGVH